MQRAVLLFLIGVMLTSFGCSSDTYAPILGPEHVAGVVQQDQAVTANPGVLPRTAMPFGKSYGEWSIEAWQFLAAAPLDRNPGLDETGEFVDDDQSGPVWFLMPNFGGYSVRQAEIPAGTALFVAVISYEASTREGLGATEEELRSGADYVVSLMENVWCEIDGRMVEGLASYRVASPSLFSLTVPDDNVFDLWGVPTDAGTYYPSVADGYYVMLAPLSVGKHTIHIHGELVPFDYVTDVTYQLTIRPAGEFGAPHADRLGSIRRSM